MALVGLYSKKIELFDGAVTRDGCYVRIRNMVAGAEASANIDVLSEKDGFIVDQVEVRGIQLDLEAENYHTQVYNHLKTLPEFKGCQDG